MQRRVLLAPLLIGIGVLMMMAPAVHAGGGGGCHQSASSQTEATGTVVSMAALCFSPTIVRTELGATVRFVNDDQAVHNVNGVGWGSDGELLPGEAYERTFAAAGTYPFACMLHYGMTGAVVVGDQAANASVTPVSVTPATELAASSTSTGDDSAEVAWVAGAAVVGLTGGIALGRTTKRHRPHPT